MNHFQKDALFFGKVFVSVVNVVGIPLYFLAGIVAGAMHGVIFAFEEFWWPLMKGVWAKESK